MAKEDIKIERVVQGDEKEIVKLLSQAKLPAQDLTLEKLEHFLVAKAKDGSVIGAVGVELYQDVGLLRSLVVHPAYQGKGLGKWLTREVESLLSRRASRPSFSSQRPPQSSSQSWDIRSFNETAHPCPLLRQTNSRTSVPYQPYVCSRLLNLLRQPIPHTR